MKNPVILSVIYITILPAAALAQSSGTVNIVVSNQINQQSGVNGRLQLPMSTSFQLAPWSYQFFTLLPNATTPLGALDPPAFLSPLPTPGTSPNSTPCSRRSKVRETTALSSKLAPPRHI